MSPATYVTIVVCVSVAVGMIVGYAIRSMFDQPIIDQCERLRRERDDLEAELVARGRRRCLHVVRAPDGAA